MQRYITQLLEDMEKAKGHHPPPINYALLYPDHPAAEYGLDHIIEWENAVYWNMNDLFDIPSEAFPPEEQLSEEETKALVNGICSLWQAFNIYVNIPANCPPARTIYKVLLNYWRNEKIQYVSQGMLDLDLCDYEPKNCIWGTDYCTCKEFMEEEENHDETNNDLAF